MSAKSGGMKWLRGVNVRLELPRQAMAHMDTPLLELTAPVTSWLILLPCVHIP